MSDLYQFLLQSDPMDIQQKSNEYDNKQNEFQQRFNELFTETTNLIQRSRLPTIMPPVGQIGQSQTDILDPRNFQVNMMPSLMHTLDKPIENQDVMSQPNESQFDSNVKQSPLKYQQNEQVDHSYQFKARQTPMETRSALSQHNISNQPAQHSEEDRDSDASFQYNRQKNQFSEFYAGLKEGLENEVELELEKQSTGDAGYDLGPDEVIPAGETKHMKELRSKRARSVRRRKYQEHSNSPESRKATSKLGSTVQYDKITNRTPNKTPVKTQQEMPSTLQPQSNTMETPLKTIKKVFATAKQQDQQSFSRIFGRENSSYNKYRKRNASEDTNTRDNDDLSRAVGRKNLW